MIIQDRVTSLLASSETLGVSNVKLKVKTLGIRRIVAMGKKAAPSLYKTLADVLAILKLEVHVCRSHAIQLHVRHVVTTRFF